MRVQEQIVSLPAIDCDLLSGLKQIAAWYALSVAQVRAKIDAGEIPVFRLRGRNTVFALKSSQNRHWQQAEEAYKRRSTLPAVAPAPPHREAGAA